MRKYDLNDYFVYSEDSPSFLRRRKDWVCHNGGIRAKSGEPTGYLESRDGYYYVFVEGEKRPAHRVILEMFGHDLIEKKVDHIDGNRQNNHISNLRVVSSTENNRNMVARKDNKSGVAGVMEHTVKRPSGKVDVYWMAQWYTLDGERVRKFFPVSKYGDSAFDRAKAARDEAIHVLNTLGAGYTERHGNA